MRKNSRRVAGLIGCLTGCLVAGIVMITASTAYAQLAKPADNGTAEEATELNTQVAQFVLAGRYAEGLPLAQRALAIRDKVLKPDNVFIAQSLDNLAALYVGLERHGDARPLLLRALAIREKTQGPEHPQVANSLHSLGKVYIRLGRPSDALAPLQRAVAVQEKVLGTAAPQLAASIDSLGQANWAAARFGEAEPLLRRALAIRESALGPDHELVATSLNNLATLYLTVGRHSEAEPIHKRALAIRQKALGPNHPLVAVSLNNLAELFRNQARYSEAEPLHKRALAIRQTTLGPDHPDVAISLNNLASLYYHQNQFAQAEPLFKRSLDIRVKTLGPNHPDVATGLSNLAAMYQRQGRFGEIELIQKRSLAIRENALGADHPDVATTLNNLAELYGRQGRYRDAEPLHKRSLAIREKALGSDHPDVANSLNNLALLNDKQGRFSDAEPLFKRSLAIWDKALGADHLDVAQALNGLAWLHARQGNLNSLNSAAEYWQAATDVLARRAVRATAGQALVSTSQSEAQRHADYFLGLIKVSFRRAEADSSLEAKLARDMFEIAQWPQASEAAAALAQMAARVSTGDPKLALIARERQELLVEWQQRDQARVASAGLASDKRDKAVEAANAARLMAIDTRVADVDKRLATDFPDYATQASPKPLSAADAQANLRPDEALILIIDTPEIATMRAETFVWVVTPTDVRWVYAPIGKDALQREVAALRCGLDEAAWQGKTCASATGASYSAADAAAGKSPPFDAARAHRLYQTLFGAVEDLIKGKHLLLVPTGPLTQLPLQVLVSALPPGSPPTWRVRELDWLGIEQAPLTEKDRQRARWTGPGGVKITKLSPAGLAGVNLELDDILLPGDNKKKSGNNVTQAVGVVRLNVWRDGNLKEHTFIVSTLREDHSWFPDATQFREIHWLARDHALTILPAASSLKALRRFGRASAATLPMIGFGNPLLDGPDARYAALAKSARDKQHCAPPKLEQFAALASVHRGGAVPVARAAGLADIAALRSQTPLPETTDELCAVARDLGADVRELRLGASATEGTIKALSASGALARYRIVHMATHGLLAGQLSARSEPGLILTPPASASADDDGYLTASEIAGLKLDANWVILSACNTAAGGANGAEALSGLARAFFFAQARALLVSHWEVDTLSTVRLITTSVKELTRDHSIGRAEALRRAMLAMMDQGTPAEAHPANWAPFVVVGEGGAGR